MNNDTALPEIWQGTRAFEEISDALKDHKILFLYGPHGIGKSACIHHLGFNPCSQGDTGDCCIPFQKISGENWEEKRAYLLEKARTKHIIVKTSSFDYLKISDKDNVPQENRDAVKAFAEGLLGKLRRVNALGFKQNLPSPTAPIAHYPFQISYEDARLVLGKIIQSRDIQFVDGQEEDVCELLCAYARLSVDDNPKEKGHRGRRYYFPECFRKGLNDITSIENNQIDTNKLSEFKDRVDNAKKGEKLFLSHPDISSLLCLSVPLTATDIAERTTLTLEATEQFATFLSDHSKTFQDILSGLSSFIPGLTGIGIAFLIYSHLKKDGKKGEKESSVLPESFVMFPHLWKSLPDEKKIAIGEMYDSLLEVEPGSTKQSFDRFSGISMDEFTEQVNKIRDSLKLLGEIKDDTSQLRKDTRQIIEQNSQLLKSNKEIKETLTGSKSPSASVITNLHQIPRVPDDFQGRKAEIEEILDNFDNGYSISGLQGMGGIGKTALALVIAQELTKDRYPDAQFFLDMQGTTKPLSPEYAMRHVILSINPLYQVPDDNPKNRETLRSQYLSVLAGKRALLLFDNVRDKDQVKPLIPPAGCAMLVTSRIRFTLPGLKSKNLDHLSPPEAHALLLEIAPRIGDAAETMAIMCGFLPIALRNAASALAESPDLGVEEYMARLKSGKVSLDELAETSFTASYDLLQPELRERWCQLSVFPGDFDKKAVTAVWNTDADSASKDLSELVRWNLVDYRQSTKSGKFVETGRYVMHDFARVFTETHVSENLRKSAQKQFATHYLQVLNAAESIYQQGGDGVLAGLSLFDMGWKNIQAGQELAFSHADNDPEWAQYCSRYPYVGKTILPLRLHPHDLINWNNAALPVARRLNEVQVESCILLNLGNAYELLGDYKRAIDYYEKALAIYREIGDRHGEGSALGNLGKAYRSLGDYEKAINCHEKALTISQEFRDRHGEGIALLGLGNTYNSLGVHKMAINYHEKALTIYREIGDRHGEGRALVGLGNTYYSSYIHRDYMKDIDNYEKALTIFREIGSRQGEGATLANLGNSYYSVGDFKRAIDYYEKALTVSREIGDRHSEGRALLGLGIAYRTQGDYKKAIDYYENSLTIYQEIELPQTQEIRVWLESLKKIVSNGC